MSNWASACVPAHHLSGLAFWTDQPILESMRFGAASKGASTQPANGLRGHESRIRCTCSGPHLFAYCAVANGVVQGRMLDIPVADIRRVSGLCMQIA